MADTEIDLLRYDNSRLKAELEEFTEAYQRSKESGGSAHAELDAIRMHMKHVKGVAPHWKTLKQVQEVTARLRVLEAKAELAAALEHAGDG